MNNVQSAPKPINLVSVPRFELEPQATPDQVGFLRRYGEFITALLGLLLIVGSVMFAEQISPYHPTMDMDLRNGFAPPFWAEGGSLDHPLGTDKMGRDILARTLHGGKVSLEVAFIASTVATIAGLFVGLVGGYLGGVLDRLLVLGINLWISFPFLVLALAVIAAAGNSLNILIILLSLAGWVYPAQVTRAQTLKVRHLDYVAASVALGAKPARIIRTHILPNVLSVNIVLWTFSVGTLVLIESSLSFIGLGVSPPTPSWGNMLSDGRIYLQDAWWLSVFPGLALMLTVLSVNSVGDALQKLNSRRS